MATPPGSSSLNAARRSADLAGLGRDPVDLLVIGGGVTGTGVALDAASRGLSVVLAEKHDLAFGTSRWSSKLVHGGLRYLATGDVAVAYESAVERGILLGHTATHLVRPLPQMVPLLPSVSRRGAGLIRTGYLAGDALRRAAGTSARLLPRSRRIDPRRVRGYAPTVRDAGLRGGLVFWDGQLVDDARLVVGLARTAAAHGATILTRCEAVQVTGSGAVLRDRLTDTEYSVDAKMVINAAGVWSGEVAPGINLRPSRGTHLVFPHTVFGGLSVGLTVPVPGERSRFVFALPSGRHVYVGLTDEDAPGPVPDVPRPTDGEIDFLLATINTALRDPVGRDDMVGSYSGLRPLLDNGTGRTSDVSRTHAVLTAPDGLVTVVGGKLTTYRRMAADAVDTAIARAGVTAGPCRTRRLRLVGAAPAQTLARVEAPDRLVNRYGTEAPLVLSGDPAWNAPIADGIDVTAAELRFGVRHEGALDESDLLDRRTRIGFSAGDARRALPAVREALADGGGAD